MTKTLDQLAEEFSEKAEQLELKLSQIKGEIAVAERDAYARALKDAMTARAVEFDGKTIVLKVPADKIDDTLHGARKLQIGLNCRFVVLSEETDLKELHEVDLKAIGLKRDE